MPPRNLTTKSPHIGSASSDNSGDPFERDSNSFDGYEGSSDDQLKMNNSTTDMKQLLIFKNSTNNNSSFQNSSRSSVFNPFASTNGIPLLDSENKNQRTPEFDRYPMRMSGSRVTSVQSMGSKPIYHNRDSSHSYSDISERSSNPFLVDTEFSPFGGYPASSFPLLIDEKEEDDYLHNPDPIADAEDEKNHFWKDIKAMDKRSGWSLFGLIILLLGAIALFVVLPVVSFTGVADHPTITSYEILTDYVYPTLSAIRTNLVDTSTPESALTRKAKDGSTWSLVFSDEFAVEGRTFYEGDDQFWYAPDFHYAATQDLEWYDPDAVTTANGTLQLRMDAFKNHNLYYRSGMLHSWNRMCFTQGIMEVSAKLPHYGNITGLWPGMWSMGNLGRPGYMATTDGVWPYSYEACDAGITPNQSAPDGISYLPGQRLNSCTCDGEEHPNQGTGRGAPEIDIIEGEVDTNIRVGVASQSLQLAPMDIWYMPDYNFIEVYNDTITTMNTYAGGPFQQAVSAITTLNTEWYERGVGERYFQSYSYEYLNDNDSGYIRWFVGDNPTFTMHAWALSPSGNVDWRRISKEPMSMIINFGISNNWAYIDWPSLDFPMTMEVDYVRIYQPNDSISTTCDPDDYPTYDYIENHRAAYDIWNYTKWEAAGYSIPKNKMTGCGK
ncbi:beta-glucan synthesis-associated protein [Martiniozyma asiatica (nom. inval.)]|nr:beta-glucan synthesis-associated protein [Martiniozyma asiatica]